MKMSMDGKGREKTKKASEEEDPHLHEGDDGEKRNAEESLDESSTETRIEVKEKTGSWKNKDLRLRWIVLMRKMLKDLEMEALDEDPKLEMMNLEDHLGQVKKKAAIWQSRARERITVMDTGSEIQEEEERRIIYGIPHEGCDITQKAQEEETQKETDKEQRAGRGYA